MADMLELCVPPRPDPANMMPVARPRLRTNHCGNSMMMGKYRNPPAIPKRTPCNAMRSRILVFGENIHAITATMHYT